MSANPIVNDLLKLAVAAAEGMVARAGQRAVPRLAGGVVAGAFATLFAITALACLLLGLWIVLAPRLGAVGALLCVASVLLALCGATLAAMRIMLKAHRAPPPPSFVGGIVTELSNLTRDGRGSALLAAFMAGAAAGRADTGRADK